MKTTNEQKSKSNMANKTGTLKIKKNNPCESECIYEIGAGTEI